ncbi:MAG: class I SAM-dependent methyltransferase [Pirellulaceae bacterium]
MARNPVPQWRLPPGVTRGLMDYVQSEHIADDYDAYFAENKLFEFDEQVLVRHLGKPSTDRNVVVADLGCGTGRALVPLARRGFRGLAVDLSRHMLEVVREKADVENLPIDCVRANLVTLDCLADDSVDHAICLFSTLGMIRGRENRRRVLSNARRIVRGGGRFVLHVHNYWYNLYDPGGPWWLLKNLARSCFDREIERGDKFFPYRGVNNMFLHVFTRRELAADLRAAGFRIQESIPLAPTRVRRLPATWFCQSLRANGWIVVCE